MNLSKEDAQRATEELLGLLAQHPEGLPTKELIGTPRFHGMSTLSPKQVARLLRASGKVSEYEASYGLFKQTIWSLKEV